MESDLGYQGDCYKTTYSGEGAAGSQQKKKKKGNGRWAEQPDSDEDPYHITMPFKRSDEMRKKIFEEPDFETDEEPEIDLEQYDKQNAAKLVYQNSILATMQKTIEKMAEELKKEKLINAQLAERLKKEMCDKHPDIEGLNEDYELVPSEEEDASK